MAEPRREEPKEVIEPAARKVEEDNDYDEVEESKRGSDGTRIKENSCPNSKGTNGISNGADK